MSVWFLVKTNSTYKFWRISDIIRQNHHKNESWMYIPLNRVRLTVKNVTFIKSVFWINNYTLCCTIVIIQYRADLTWLAIDWPPLWLQPTNFGPKRIVQNTHLVSETSHYKAGVGYKFCTRRQGHVLQMHSSGCESNNGPSSEIDEWKNVRYKHFIALWMCSCMKFPQLQAETLTSSVWHETLRPQSQLVTLCSRIHV